MNIKPIKSEADYEDALRMLEALIESDPAPDSEEGDRLSILSTLVESYEANLFPQSLPSPIDAIKFRMEQSNLKPADLIPFLGSRSRVSEVLSGKRPLSLDMIRALESGLGIPSTLLIRESGSSGETIQSWSDSLIREMDKRGYFPGEHFDGSNKETLLSIFFQNRPAALTQMAWRKSNPRISVRTDSRALVAWAEFLKQKASHIKIPVKYEDGVVNKVFLQDVIKLSSKVNGPLLAQEFLRSRGIVLVVADHLPKTRVDGVSILDDREKPVIGLSLRFDRLDNFWFTLLHELSHVALHLNGDAVYFDELEDSLGIDVSGDEMDADEFAQEAIIPKEKWEISPAKVTPSAMAAESLADELDINVAVVAGYIRHKTQNFFYLRKLVSGDDSKVRYLFESQLDVRSNA